MEAIIVILSAVLVTTILVMGRVIYKINSARKESFRQFHNAIVDVRKPIILRNVTRLSAVDLLYKDFILREMKEKMLKEIELFIEVSDNTKTGGEIEMSITLYDGA